jgi:hypothetical protein
MDILPSLASTSTICHKKRHESLRHSFWMTLV